MLNDTDPKIKAMRLTLLRQATPAQKMKSISDLSAFARQLALSNIRAKNPQANEAFIRYKLAERMWGKETARKLLGEAPFSHHE